LAAHDEDFEACIGDVNDTAEFIEYLLGCIYVLLWEIDCFKKNKKIEGGKS